MAAISANSEDLPGVRWVEPASLHVTLCYLGELAEAEAARAKGVATQVAAESAPFVFGLQGEGVFPDERAPRVLFVEVHDGREALVALGQRLQRALATEGLTIDARPFHPHVTLARLSRAAPPRVLDRATRFGEVHCDRFVLMESRGGYHERASYPLGYAVRSP